MFQSFQIIFVIASGAFCSNQLRISKDDLVPPGICLVKAEALTSNSFKILHVYVGEQNLVGKAFTETLLQPGPHGSSTNYPTPRLVKPGQLGIWWLKKEEGTEKYIPYHPLMDLVFFYPALNDGSKGGDAYYKSAIVGAEAVEKIYQADDKNRMEVIDDIIKHGEAEAAFSSVRILYNISNPKITDYLRSLAMDKSITLRAQFEINNILNRKDKNWPNSPDQFKLVGRWMTGPLKDRDGVKWDESLESSLVKYVGVSVKLGYFSDTDRLDLMIMALSNRGRSERFDREMVAEVKAMESWREKAFRGGTKQDKEMRFDYLVKKMREGKTPDNGIAAAKLLVLFTPLSREHEMVLQKLSRDLNEVEVRNEIEKVLSPK